MSASDSRPAWRLVIHGGAGMIERDRVSAGEDRAIRTALNHALETGTAVLAGGGAALDAVEAAVSALEDDPHFNAGHGSVFTWEGAIEMDAAVMDGRDRNAGAVSGVTATRNPVRLARAVMEESPHVFLSREGADLFSVRQGLPQVPPDYFETAERRRQLDELRARPESEHSALHLKYGTVGAVALDTAGNLAAATSTGGLTGKRWGRIGDSPLIGAGTYADNRACAVSATGAGEYFIRAGVAHEICARLRLLGGDARAVADAVMADVKALGGSGGVIVVTPRGEGIWSFNTPGMYRGEASPDGRSVALYGDD
ncbi:isoaspartyl peptidase/L-asparaginase [Sphingosinicella sp. LHD-64]|uniref:isoaspartyl peptidase/L-asparaginase family protein n=1 Tax=Sphingosinicella sp. LHD-64 TaxID=3072139 RepID=UPI00280C6961|nr:isoaspartyl peptidase/L-asparaginase [Sphingosinicella sp. LHD-64]MDQ8758032.1 isoaspartyl peptidase/L-asparaginase [Sphingosinicella sp. LHD-64]